MHWVEKARFRRDMCVSGPHIWGRRRVETNLSHPAGCCSFNLVEATTGNSQFFLPSVPDTSMGYSPNQNSLFTTDPRHLSMCRRPRNVVSHGVIRNGFPCGLIIRRWISRRRIGRRWISRRWIRRRWIICHRRIGRPGGLSRGTAHNASSAIPDGGDIGGRVGEEINIDINIPTTGTVGVTEVTVASVERRIAPVGGIPARATHSYGTANIVT